MFIEDNPISSTKHTFLVSGAKFTIDSRYQLIKPIGYGAYGIVVSAYDSITNSTVAIKKISRVFTNIIEAKRTLREIKFLTALGHDNIMRIREVCTNDENYTNFTDVYIISDLMDTDLHQVIASPQSLSHDHVKYFIYQLLRGLKYLHSANILHRDLKPSNLLVNANCDLKICDFGLARLIVHYNSSDSISDTREGFLTEYVATRWYRAPEIMLSWKEYTNAVDLWSVGCILAEIINRKPLFPGRDYMHQLALILDTLGTPSYEDTEFIASAKARAYIRSLPVRSGVPFSQLMPNAPPEAVDLLKGLLTFAPHKRLTAEQCLNHPYLAILHDETDEPSSTTNLDFDFRFEDMAMTPESLKQLLYYEITKKRLV